MWFRLKGKGKKSDQNRPQINEIAVILKTLRFLNARDHCGFIERCETTLEHK